MPTILKRVLIVVAILVVAAFGIRRAMVWNKTRDVLPTFSAIPDGNRAPTIRLAGLEVGRTTLADVQALTAKLGWSCRDTSMRGLMQLGREQAQAKMAEAEAKGEDPDTVSGASRAYYHSKKEQNPQVQWACEEIDLQALDATFFEDGGDKNTVIFIFDSEHLPLRYLVTSRKFMSQSQTRVARDKSIAALSAILGPPHASLGTPNENPEQKMFARHQIFRQDWKYADRAVSITVMNLGSPRGIDLREIIEVPWPIEVKPTGGAGIPDAAPLPPG